MGERPGTREPEERAALDTRNFKSKVGRPTSARNFTCVVYLGTDRPLGPISGSLASSTARRGAGKRATGASERGEQVGWKKRVEAGRKRDRE